MGHLLSAKKASLGVIKNHFHIHANSSTSHMLAEVVCKGKLAVQIIDSRVLVMQLFPHTGCI